ncbi:MAG TPA: Cys-Gln thioester bond-forming surface protein [Streptomyces sp.]|nr:Cys-Gln thioester bond-forming surface protein [Streptomyces sp.]
MISVRGRVTTRLAAAAVASGLLAAGAIAGAGTAVAEEATPHSGGATATLNGLKVHDTAIINHNGKKSQVSAGLFEMTVDGGGTLTTYCVDVFRPTQKEARYEEVAWKNSLLQGNSDAGKIRWILQNSYPQVNDLGALAGKAGVPKLTEKAAAAGTQVAIWRFSDKVNVEARDPNAEKLADYLEKAAQNLPEPQASLTLDPAAVSGKSGEKLGPITVRTNAQGATVTPGTQAKEHGVKVVGKDGQEVSSAKDGDEIFFDVPEGAEDGTASLTVQASTQVPVGRVFTGIGKHANSQTQILAGSSESTVSATAVANWATKGPIPAVTAEKNCVKGGVDVTASNQGDKPFVFSLAGKEYEVAAGQSQTVTVPVQEDQPYNIKITGPNGFEETFTGILDCETDSSQTGGPGEESGEPSTEPSPATVGGAGDTGGAEAGDTGSTGSTDGDLAETGSSSNTPIIAGVALLLVVLGGGAVFFLRKKKPASGTEG